MCIISFNTIFYSNSKCVPYTTGTLPSCTQTHATESQYMKKDLATKKTNKYDWQEQIFTYVKKIKTLVSWI